MDNYTFGRKQKKIQWRANLPVVLTVLVACGLLCGVTALIISQVKPDEEQVSIITITRNTPSASELNLSAPLVDYHPNKDECQKEKLNDIETDEERDKRLKECEAKKEEKKKEEEKKSEVASGEVTEVLGEQEEKSAFIDVLARVIGASAAKNNNSKPQDSSASEELVGGGASSADGGEHEVDNGVGENADN